MLIVGHFPITSRTNYHHKPGDDAYDEVLAGWATIDTDWEHFRDELVKTITTHIKFLDFCKGRCELDACFHAAKEKHPCTDYSWVNDPDYLSWGVNLEPHQAVIVQRRRQPLEWWWRTYETTHRGISANAELEYWQRGWIKFKRGQTIATPFCKHEPNVGQDKNKCVHCKVEGGMCVDCSKFRPWADIITSTFKNYNYIECDQCL